MLLMVKKVIRDWVLHAMHQYPKPNNKYLIDYDPDKESLYLMYWDSINLIVIKMSVDRFKWKKKTFKFDEDFIRNYDEYSNKKFIHQVNVKFPWITQWFTVFNWKN